MLKKILNIKYPIIQAPMLGVTSPQMVATSSNMGILGSLPVGGLSAQQTKELIRKTKSLTNERFSVNLFANNLKSVKMNQKEYLEMKDYIYNLGNLDVKEKMKELPELITDLKLYNYHNQIDCLLEEGIDIISFTFGKLDKETIKKIKSFNPNSILIGTATCLEEGMILQDSGIDILCAQGIEAGGHRGSFINDDKPDSIDRLPQIGLLPLVNSLLDNCSIPIIASGGITNKTDINSLVSMGVAGVQIGSLFICSNQSLAIESYKDELMNSKDTSTALTRSYSGRWARGIKNEFMGILELDFNPSKIPIPPYPIQNEITKPLRSISQSQNNNQYTNQWSGQLGYKSKKLPISEIIKELID